MFKFKGKGSETVKYKNEKISTTKLFGANFLHFGLRTKNVLKIENLEMPS